MVKELEIEVFQLKEQLRKSDADNYHLKMQLKNRNEEIKKLKKIVNNLKDKLNHKSKERYKNRKRG